MYLLQRNPQLIQTVSLPQAQEAVAIANERLADSSAGLTFDPDKHRYHLYGREMQSVSSIVEHFDPFDQLAIATRCSLNPKHKHFGKTPEEILGLWKEEARQAADAGTKAHAFGEACFLYMLGQDNEIEPEMKDRITADGLVAVEPKEESLAKWWASQDWNRFVPVAKETRVANPSLGYAGTFDLLLYDLYNAGYCLRDYKSNKDLERWFGDMLRAPLNMIKASPLGHYIVQQTLYTIVLRLLCLPVISNELIWLAEEFYRDYILPMEYDKVVAYAVEKYNQEKQK